MCLARRSFRLGLRRWNAVAQTALFVLSTMIQGLIPISVFCQQTNPVEYRQRYINREYNPTEISKPAASRPIQSTAHGWERKTAYPHLIFNQHIFRNTRLVH